MAGNDLGKKHWRKASGFTYNQRWNLRGFRGRAARFPTRSEGLHDVQVLSLARARNLSRSGRVALQYIPRRTGGRRQAAHVAADCTASGATGAESRSRLGGKQIRRTKTAHLSTAARRRHY